MKHTFKWIIDNECGRQITFVLSDENDNYEQAFFDVIAIMDKIVNCIEFKGENNEKQN